MFIDFAVAREGEEVEAGEEAQKLIEFNASLVSQGAGAQPVGYTGFTETQAKRLARGATTVKTDPSATL